MRRRCAAGGASLLLAVWVTAASAFRIPVGDRLLDFDGVAEFRHVERVDRGTTLQDPFGRLRLGLGIDVVDRLRAVVVTTGRAGGTARNPRGAGILNYDDTIQDFSPSLDFEEAYLELARGGFDVRAGIQKFGWGKLDSFQPNDLLNPERYNDPALEEEDERKIGVPALSLTAPWPKLLSPPGLLEAALTFVWLPIYVPPRVPDQDERWYPPLGRAPPRAEFIGFSVRNESTLRNANLPERSLENGTFAVRFSGNFNRIDFSLYYFDGFDPQPIFDVVPRGFVRLDLLDPDLLDFRSEITIVPSYQRIRSFGFDLAYTVAGVTLRAEAAYVIDRLYTRSVFDIVESGELAIGPINPALLALALEQELTVAIGQVNFPLDAVEWGIGADTYYGETFLLAQLNQTSIFGRDRGLLIGNQESRIVLTARRSFFDETLEAELNGLYGIQGVYGVLQPQVVYDFTDTIDLTLGYVMIEGHEDSTIGQFKRNDEAYVKVRLLF